MESLLSLYLAVILFLVSSVGVTAQVTHCDNGGTLVVDLALGAHCECPDGYTGSTCKDPLPCLGDPCERGVCRNNGTTYHCQCPGGYSGRNCETFDGYCTSTPCNSRDSLATCKESSEGYECSCSRDSIFGLNCEAQALDPPPSGCPEEPENYCICHVDGLPVKISLPRPDADSGIVTRDIVAGVVGSLIGWILGTILLALFHTFCYSALGGGHDQARMGRRTSKVDTIRPQTASSMISQSTHLSMFMASENGAPRQNPSSSNSVLSSMPHPPTTRRMPNIDIDDDLSGPRQDGADTRGANIYRAGFVDGSSHPVSSRKSPMTYNSASRDW